MDQGGTHRALPDGGFQAGPAFVDKLKAKLGGKIHHRAEGKSNGGYDHRQQAITVVHWRTGYSGIPHEVHDTITLAHEAGHRHSHQNKIAPRIYYDAIDVPADDRAARLTPEQKQAIRDEESRAWDFAENELRDYPSPFRDALAQRRAQGLAWHESYLTEK